VSRPGIFVEPSGNVHVVTQGVNNTLFHCAATPGSSFNCVQIGAAGSTFSAPQVVVRSPTGNPANEIDVVAEGPNQSVSYYHFFGQPSQNMAPYNMGNNITVSPPSVAVTNGGLVSVTLQSPGTGSPKVYQAMPGAAFTITQLSQ
jgi:hypothetical protein